MIAISRAAQALRVAAALLYLSIPAAWIIVPRLVESAYSGTSWPIFNDLISGQQTHPLQDYLDSTKSALFGFSIAALAIGALALTPSVESGRQAIKKYLTYILPLLLPLIAIAWGGARALDSLHLPHFGDEDEKIVAGWLISEGERLYGSIFAHHGPLNYLIAHVVYAVTESTDLAVYRLTQWAIIGFGGVALAASPALSGWRERLSAGSLFFILAALLYPLWRGHELLYHVQGGVLFTVAVSLFLLPLWLGIRTSAYGAALAGAVLAAAATAAYPFAVSIALFVLGTILILLARNWAGRQAVEIAIPLCAGVLLALGIVGVWLFLHGDYVGFFVYHFYFNQQVYATFINFDPLSALGQLRKIAEPRSGWPLWTIAAFFLWLVSNIKKDHNAILGWRSWSLLIAGLVMLFVAFLYLNPRGVASFKAAPLYIVSLGLFSIAAARTVSAQPSLSRQAALPLATAAVMGIIAYTPALGPASQVAVNREIRSAAIAQSANDEIVRMVQAWVAPSETIQAVVFNPKWYLLASRRPASGHYYYLPWQASYAQKPILEKNIDICAQIRTASPKVIIWDQWKVWEKYDLRDYEPCLYEIIMTEYSPVEGTPSLLRRKSKSPAPSTATNELPQ